MVGSRLKPLCAVALVTAVCGLVASACGEHDPGVDEPAREGLAIDLGGVGYNAFLTRELNLSIPPDKALYDGPAAPPGSALYGVFIQACNRGDDPAVPTDDFVVEDNQGNEFRPLALPQSNQLAYHARQLGKDQCIPEAGSFAQQGPTAGSMLLFEFPLDDAENRPLELIITAQGEEPEQKRIELDL